MDYFINNWESLGDAAKQVIIICSLIMVVMFYVMVKVLAAHDKFKYGPDDEDDDEYDDDEY